MFNKIRSLFIQGYESHPEAVIVSCFYNPQNSPYRKSAFDTFYKSIKHLNYRIIECSIGDAQPQLSHYKDKNITFVQADELLWHKETLLNQVITKLPPQFKYVFWIDADVMFDNDYWLIEGVQALQNCNMIQPFEFCIHLEKDKKKPNLDYISLQKRSLREMLAAKMWRSFCSNVHSLSLYSDNYNEHGHVGFAWGARREVLEKVPLYEKALIGGADHIIAHAAANQLSHSCITKTFTEDIDNVQNYMSRLSSVVKGKIGYCKGTLFHIWHGDIEKRQYFQRVKDFTPKVKAITERDSNGFYKSNNQSTKTYISKYYESREVYSSDDSSLYNAIFEEVLSNTDETLCETTLNDDNCDCVEAVDSWDTNSFS